jgi:hypothetical protein
VTACIGFYQTAVAQEAESRPEKKSRSQLPRSYYTREPEGTCNEVVFITNRMEIITSSPGPMKTATRPGQHCGEAMRLLRTEKLSCSPLQKETGVGWERGYGIMLDAIR